MGRSKRPRGSRRPWLALTAVAGLAVLFVAASTATLAPSTFESNDGNLVVNTSGNKDWSNAPNLVTATDKPTGQQDDSLGEGTKEDDAVPTIVDGSIPNNKSDLRHFYTAHEKVSGDEFLYLGWTRANTLGTANMDFEFNQATSLTSNGITPVRTPGDMLITFDFASGGNKVELGLSRWTATGPCQANGGKAPCWGPIVDLDAAGVADGAVNDGFVVTNPISGGTLADKTFGEAAINLTDAGVFPPDACVSFGRAYLKSRSSDSFTAALKDFIAPIPVSIQNCGTIIIRKQTDPNGAAGSFAYSTTGGLSPASFSLSDDGERMYTNQLAGAYTVTEAGPAPAFDLVSIDCTVSAGGTSTTSTDVASGTASITLAPGDTVTCTYTNRQRGRILIDKVTDPAGDPQSFDFTLSGGPSALAQSFSLTDASAPHDSGEVLAGAGYSASETLVAGWDLASATCNDGSPVSNIDVSPGETVTCTFVNRARGSVNIHKQDDRGEPLAGAVFTLFTDSAPLNGPPPHGAEDLPTAYTCTTGADGNCSIGDIVPGQYWAVETQGVPGHTLAADQHVVVSSGSTISLTFVDPREFRIIVLVCREADDTLYPSTVTVDGENKTSLASGGGGAIADADLCALGGASYGGKHTGDHPGNVNIPVTP